MTHPNTPKPDRFTLPRAMIVAAALSAAFLGADTLAQKGKDTMAVSPFDAAAMPEDGNEVVDIVAHYLPEIPGRSTPGYAFTFKIEPGWHLYWKNNGDTGMPIMLKLTPPEGVTVGEILWPTPKRYEHSGGLLDYIYEEEVTLIVPISGRPTGDRGDGRAEIEFLVCKEACIPGEQTVLLDALDRFPTDWRVRAARSSSRLPGLAAGAACWKWDGTTLVFTADEAEEAETMIFYPEAGENLRPVNALRDGQAQGDTLRFAYRDTVRKADIVRGVLEIRNRSGQAAFYEVQAPAPK
jgi:thiol:disulfide interchange protein DsbD